MSARVRSDSILSRPETLGLAVALISATQLRVPGAPVGIGELLLASWCGLNLLRSIGSRGGDDQAIWQLYWLLSFATLAMGALSAIALDVFNSVGMRDGIAHLLVASVCLACVRRPSPSATVLRAARTYAVLAAVGYGACLVLALTGHGAWGPVDMWYGLRFRGLAENPNQLALAMLPIPIIAFEAMGASAHGWERPIFAAALVAGIVVGVASLSNALMLAWSVGSVVLVPGAIGWLRRIGVRSVWGLVRQVALPLALLSMLGGTAFVYRATIHAAGQAAYDAGGEGDDRVARWRNGLSAIEKSPLVGLGPGSFSGPTGPFQGEEAHNTAIDWTMSAGAIGLMALLSLFALAAWRSRSAPLRVALLVVLLAFTTFHFALRQPIFWLLMLLLISAPVIPTRHSRPFRHPSA